MRENKLLKRFKLLLAMSAVLSLGILSAQDECLPGGDDNNVCLSFDNIDGTAGTLDILYSSEGEINIVNFFFYPLIYLNLCVDS